MPGTVYRFGECVLDATSGELRRNGRAVRLQPQPLQVLLALLRRPGQVVTREELRSSLWAEDTYVEFDDGLNHAIRRLRDALNDTAQVPRYIETVPRRGYRLVAPVEVEPVETSAGAVELLRKRKWLVVAGMCVVVAVVAGIAFSQRRSQTHIGSLAVLPLADFSSSQDQDYFADGITEELTTELARIKTLRVISRTSAMRLKGAKLSLQQIGHELGVDAVIEGSVQRSGNRVRISAQLVQVAGERHLWAESYERESRDILRVRSEVARDIAAQVRNEVAPEESAGLSTTRVLPEAFDAYLIGTRLANRGDKEGFEKSIHYFEEAIRLDPTFALAYAELGESHGMLAYMADARGEQFLKAQAAFNKAFEIDPTVPEAQVGTADLRLYWDWDWSQCEGPFRQAAGKYPNSAHIQYHYGLCHFIFGRYDEALRYLENARRVDPFSPMINREIGQVLSAAGRYEEAIEQLLKTRDLEPDNPATYSLLAWAYERTGKEAESAQAYITSQRLAGDPENEIQALEQAYRSGGKPAFERQRRSILKLRLKSLQGTQKPGTVGPIVLASLAASAGEADMAFGYLERAYAERSPRLVWIKSSIPLEPLQRDPRFHALVQRMGLPD